MSVETGRTPERADSPPAPDGPRLLAAWYDGTRHDDLAGHERRFGRLPRYSRSGQADLVRAVDAAGLRGRGGGAFPTARKLEAVAAARRPGRARPVVVANGCEGEPASRKDAALLACAPHLVLDGAVLAARALDAGHVILCVHEGSPAGRTAAALAERADGVPVQVVGVPRRYVASESSALVSYLNGGPALPTARPPRPSERGVDGMPTLVDNVETLAHLALIARFGPAWFATQGTTELPGTLLVTLGGAVARPGVREVPAGYRLRDLLGDAEPPGAVLSGGYAGGWLAPSELDRPLTPSALRAAGSTLGVPMLLALPRGACGLAETAHLLRYLAHESAGQCGPCRLGLPAIAEDVGLLAGGGRAAREANGRLARRLDVVGGRGACAHPDGAVRLARSALRVFAADLDDHLRGRPCAAAEAGPLFPNPLFPQRPRPPAGRSGS